MGWWLRIPPMPVTLAELVATLSLVADLGMGRPMERVLRQTVVAMRLGAAAGMERAACASAYYTSLLTWVGCAVDTSEVAALFGDETELYADTHDEDLGGITLAVFVARHLGRGQSGFRRIGMVGKFLATAGRSAQQLMEAHCQEASDLAGWLELGPAVCEPLLQAFERWDGRGRARVGRRRCSGSRHPPGPPGRQHRGVPPRRRRRGRAARGPRAARHAVRSGPGRLLLRPARARSSTGWAASRRGRR